MQKKEHGFVNPNPMVGAVIVKNGKVIGKGYHKKFGELHAERNALVNATTSTQGATMYITLEPCCHYGKTPPCIDAIIESGITRVVIGTLDPNSIMSGKSIDILKKHNIQVDVGVLEDECKNLIKIFTKYITTNLPYVTMKYAMTMDGKIATYTGNSKWITGEKSRLNVQKSRHIYSAIMVGVNTVICDDPLLTCRVKNYKNPVRIICDTNLRTPLSSKIVQTAKNTKTIIATCMDDKKTQKKYKDMGCKVITISKKDNHVNLIELMYVLGKKGIDSILLEGRK